MVITSRGRPAAVLIGVEGKDRETVMLETDPTFWRKVQARRAQSRLILEELNARLKRSTDTEAQDGDGALRGT